MDYFYSFNKMDYFKEKKPDGCILCNLISDKDNEKSLAILDDEYFLTCVNLYPYNPSHLIVFPKRHIVDLRQYTEIENERLFKITKYLLKIIERVYNPQGFNIGYNMGRIAGASIEHIHSHIIPRYPNEIGISELIAGKRVLAEDPKDTKTKLLKEIDHMPLSTFTT